MKVIFLTFLYFILFSFLNAQDQIYFQQKVDYEIRVKLNDQDHLLEGHVQIKYHNNSQDVLDKIGMHLWPNAYSNKGTAFAKQKLLHRSSRYLDSPIEESGNIKISNLKAGNAKAELRLVKNNPDMAWLILPDVLKPNEAIIIDADFVVKIPASFSRLGHVNQSYQVTQWYMKPAVYDRNGWHLMPYLDQGEFYSEFGDCKVSITLPENYFVAATGVLQEAEEIQFIDKRVEYTKLLLSGGAKEKLSTSSSSMKTISYIAENVHDFAFFADRNFLISKDQARLQSGKVIDTWCFYNSSEYWPNGAKYVARSIEFYSEKIGEYPWPQATAVHSALSAGGGMEYPMVTVINDIDSEKSLDGIVCHEVGHNWFYGILASNERDNPWMDEGINSYYENRYKNKYYKENYLVQNKFKGILKEANINSESEVLYQIIAHANLDQNPSSTSVDMNAISYGYDIYKRTADLFKYLQDYLGEAEFDSIMKKYFELWKFKHPYPEDLYKIFESSTLKNIDWLFKDVLTTNKKIDYSIKKVSTEDGKFVLDIRNKGCIPAPLLLSGIKGDSIVMRKWIDGFEGSKKVEIKFDNFDKLKLDPTGDYFDYGQQNNTIKTKGIFKKTEPLKIGYRAFYNSSKRTEIFLYPSVLWNYYNGIIIGLHIGSPLLPTPKWNIQFSPKYAIKSKNLAGTADISYRNNFSSSVLNYIKIGFSIKRFGFTNNELLNGIGNYLQLKPYVTIDFRTNNTKLYTSKLSYELYDIKDDIAVKSEEDSSYFRDTKTNYINKLTYYFSNPSILGPVSFKTEAYYEQYQSISQKKSRYLRMDCELKKMFRWKKRRYFEARLATSFYPINTERNRTSIASRTEETFIRGSAGAAFQGYLDYTNENNFLGRTNASGIWSQQIENRQGGLKIAPGIAQRTNLGNTNNFLLALNLSTDLPINLVGNIFRPYFDLAYVDVLEGSVSGGKYLYSGGIQLRLVKEFFEVNFPIYHSKNIQEIYSDNFGKNYFKQITFKLKFSFPHTKEIVNFIQ